MKTMLTLLSILLLQSVGNAAPLFYVDEAEALENLQAQINKVGSVDRIEFIDQNSVLLTNPLVANLAFQESKRLSYPMTADDDKTVFYFCKSIRLAKASVVEIKVEENPVNTIVVFARAGARSKYDFPFMWGQTKATISKLKCSK